MESENVERGSSPVIRTRMPAGQWLFYGDVIQTNSQFDGGLVVLNGRWVHPIFWEKASDNFGAAHRLVDAYAFAG
ncbi:MAG: hypothetical protein R6W95_09425 [Desulfosarcina sp.]